MLLEVDKKTHLATPSEYARTIDAFKQIITNDRGMPTDSQARKKLKASKELAYIYYMCDYRSPFMTQDEADRDRYLRNLLFPEEEYDMNWSPSKDVKKAMDVYRSHRDNQYVRLLKSAMAAARKLEEFFDTVDLNERDDNNKPIYKPKDVMNALANIGDVIKGLEELQEAVAKNENEESSKVRGNVTKTKYNT